MLQRRSEEEIENVRSKLDAESRDLLKPVIFGFFTGPLAGLFTFVFGTKFIKPLEASFSRVLLISVLVSLITMLVLYMVQRISGRSVGDEQTLKVCPKCLKTYDGVPASCNCGQSLEPREYYRYVSNDKH